MATRVAREAALAFVVFTPNCPGTYKGVGSSPRRKSQPAWVCSITTDRPDTDKVSGVSQSATVTVGVSGRGVILPPCRETAGGNVAMYATSFAFISNAGCIYKAVGRDRYRNPVPCHACPRKHHSREPKLDGSSRPVKLSRGRRSAGHPTLVGTVGPDDTRVVVLESARARRYRVKG